MYLSFNTAREAMECVETSSTGRLVAWSPMYIVFFQRTVVDILN